MVQDFIFNYIKVLAAKPERLQFIIEDVSENQKEIIIYADKIDAGRIIGKSGKVISAIKALAVNSNVTDKINYKITVKTIEE